MTAVFNPDKVLFGRIIQLAARNLVKDGDVIINEIRNGQRMREDSAGVKGYLGAARSDPKGKYNSADIEVSVMEGIKGFYRQFHL